jgi:hypothetical protein
MTSISHLRHVGRFNGSGHILSRLCAWVGDGELTVGIPGWSGNQHDTILIEELDSANHWLRSFLVCIEEVDMSGRAFFEVSGIHLCC